MGYDLKTNRGYDLYEVASALQKSIRRGDYRVAGYMALELFPNYAEYCWKRLLTVSAEDCFGVVTQEIKALYDSFHVVNKGKKAADFGGRIFISKAVILLCLCKHNRDADILSNFVYDRKKGISDEQIEKVMQEVRTEKMDIPEYTYDCHTRKGKRAGRTKEEFFQEEEDALKYRQMSLFDDINLSLV